MITCASMSDAAARDVLHTSLLVIGAGPYGVAVAAQARAAGIDTTVVGQPMALWRQHMPPGMFLRSGTDWHLDAAAIHTFAAFIEDRGIDQSTIDPIPIRTFLDYTDWFIAQKRLAIRDVRVTGLTRVDDRFHAQLEGAGHIVADRVVAATGIAQFQRWPAWAATLPPGTAVHTCHLTDFERLRDHRVLIIGGRQSAYEWAALAADHGAARIDLVHRHATPRFAKVSWQFVDGYIDQTLAVKGWWRRLPLERQQAIGREFWAAGRLTLEAWLAPRLPADRVASHPETSVVAVAAKGPHSVSVTLSNGGTLDVDRIVLATGYEPQLANLPYLASLLPGIAQRDGFPLLDEGFQSTVPGLYFTGFTATRDFGAFFGFTKGCPAAAAIVVEALRQD